MRNTICLLLATIVFGQSILEARAGAWLTPRARQEQTQPKTTIKERILEVPPGTMVEVRLLNKQKLRGRLGEVTNDGFSLQTAQGNKIATQQIAFADAKSVKKVEGNKGGHVLLYALAGIGALFVVLLVWALSQSGSE